jgi:sugar lactone lactonase YvrE
MKVTPDGTISRVADLSQSHPVTTGIARAQDGRLIVVELTPVRFPQGAGRVHAVGADGSVQMIARGTTTATGVAVAPDGTVYVVEHSVSLGQPPFLAPFTGRVARMAGDGSLTTVAGELMFPTIARVGPDGALYVANFSVGGDDGQGQILRINIAAQ